MFLTLLFWSLLAAEPRYAVVDQAQLSPAAAAQVKGDDAVVWWMELDRQLLVLAEDNLAIPASAYRFLDLKPDPDRLLILRGPKPGKEIAGTVLASGGRFSIVQRDDSDRPLILDDRLAHGHGPGGHAHTQTFPFQPNLQLAVWRRDVTAQKRACASIQDLVDQVDQDRWYNDVATLAQMNRNTHQLGNIQARDWLVDQFEALGLTVTTPSFMVGGTTTFNVIATLPGTSRPDDWYIVGAHFDTTSESTSSAAPGAEDNGTGTAAVLEAARIFTANPPEATILFICYSGEEQGLFGSADHAADLVAAGDEDKLRFALIMDMIGYTADADLDCLLETFSTHAAFMDQMVAAGQTYTSMRMVTSFNPFGSDHMPYLNRGLPAILAIENDYDDYPHYHRTTDEIQHVTPQMGGEVMRMNIAVLADWTGASGGLVFSEELPAWYTTNFPAGVADVNGNLRVDVADLVAVGCN